MHLFYVFVLCITVHNIVGIPLQGFRPPASPLLSQSPLMNVFTTFDALNDGDVTHWTGASVNWFSGVLVDGKFYLLLGNPNPQWASQGLNKAMQTSVSVWSTQTIFHFTAGPVDINLTFTSPLLATDFDLMSTPSHYVTFCSISGDNQQHDVRWYFDVTSALVLANIQSPLVAFGRTKLGSSAGSMYLGNNAQTPLNSTADMVDWGIMYLSHANAASTSIASNFVSRSAFVAGLPPPPDSLINPQPAYSNSSSLPTGPQVGMDRPGSDMPGSPFTLTAADPNLCWAKCNSTSGCLAWAYAISKCDTFAQPTCWLKNAFVKPSPNACRVSGTQGGAPNSAGETLAASIVSILTVTPAEIASTFAVVSVDEILSINWFGELMPPYWRRALAVGSLAIPTVMLTKSYYSYNAVKSMCDDFDVMTDAALTVAGGAQYATIAQLTYRQVWAGQQLVFSPSRNTMWFFLKEISSCGCLQTSDVIYPAFPQVLYYAPELVRLWVVTHLEYAMNFTSEKYPYPWAPHHLGHWPLANLPASQQENMPLEETAWNMLIIAAVAQRQGGDLTWLQPYWPVIQTWYQFLVTLLPFPQTQLSTDDFDGVLYNATNLAIKGVAAIAAYGYIVEKFTGNTTAADEAYLLAAQYSQVMVDYSWNADDGHFMIGYRGSRGDGGDPNSWSMIYNALWLRVLGLEYLIPSTYIDTMGSWYAANKLQKYGLPLNSRKLYTKDDWMTFLAATYYTRSETPVPSNFSTTLFQGLFHWANDTTSRVPLSDWTNTDSPTAVGFTNRPVYGAMYAPLLVTQSGVFLKDESLVRANEIFRQVWQR